MTAYTWIGGTGNWDVASDWSPAGPPSATDTATISETGAAYTVTIDTADAVKSLTENSASATVDDTGLLILNGTFNLSAGTFILGPGGTLAGGTTKVAGGTFACEGGTLRGVTFDGTLDLSGKGAKVYIDNGTVVNNAAGTGPGTINDTGSGGFLNFDGTQTFNNATINLGTALGFNLLTESGSGTVLTLGSHVTINESGNAIISDDVGDGINNQGNIKQSGTGSTVQFSGGAFTNSGTITASSSGGALTIIGTTFTNSGTLAVSNGDAVTIGIPNNLVGGTSFSNTGAITLASGGSLVLDTTFTLAELGNVTNSGGTVHIDGTLELTGGTLNGSSSLGQVVLDGGTVQGGTVTPAGLALSTSGGTLSGVTYDGVLDLSGASDSVHLASGTVVNNAAGTGAGTINDTGTYSTLYFDNTQTFNNATINLGNTAGYESTLEEYDSTGAGTVLTLASKVTIDESGFGYIADSGGLVDQGNISQTGTGSGLVILGNSFTNSGTITAASSGGALYIEPTTFINSGTLAVSNGDTVAIESLNGSGSFKNAGLFEETGGVGTITSVVTNTGTVEVTSGNLDFQGAVTGKGTDTISGASILEFDAAVSSSKTVGQQNIGFTGGGTLYLTDPKAFWGEISHFATTDAIDLLGSWKFSGFSENPAGTLATLTLVSGATKHAFDFVGDYAQGDFKITSGATSIITHT